MDTETGPDDTDLTEAEIDAMMEHASPACRTTQHCAYHGWCNRCDPGFAAVMNRVNVAIQLTEPDESRWGPLYEAVGKALREQQTDEPTSAAYQRLKAAGAKAAEEAKLHALHGMKRAYRLAVHYGDRQAIPAGELLEALGLDKDANTVESLVKHRPAHNDEFAQWLKAQRSQYLDDSTGWNIVDDLLDTYRLHADTGTPLDGHVCEGRMVGDCQHLEGTS